jgi:hypothetical protein
MVIIREQIKHETGTCITFILDSTGFLFEQKVKNTLGLYLKYFNYSLETNYT